MGSNSEDHSSQENVTKQGDFKYNFVKTHKNITFRTVDILLFSHFVDVTSSTIRNLNDMARTADDKENDASLANTITASNKAKFGDSKNGLPSSSVTVLPNMIGTKPARFCRADTFTISSGTTSSLASSGHKMKSNSEDHSPHETVENVTKQGNYRFSVF